MGLTHVEVEDFLLDHLRIFPVKRIALVEDEVDAAPKCPNVDLLAEAVLLENELGGRIVDVSTEVAASQQLLEVVRQANRVELDNTAREVLDSTRVHIPVDIVLCVEELEPHYYLL